ncbi:MAG: NACHT domain-containing protein, partial [Anaerolineae bacterium]
MGKRHLVSFFQNADELTRKVNEAVISWEKESGLQGKRQPTDWDAYRQVLVEKHRWVRLQVIAGASKDRSITKIPLTEVFEPQLIARGVSGTDVSDEVREYQKVIYGARAETSDTVDQAIDFSLEPVDDTAEFEDTLLSANPELVLEMLGREPAQVILGGPGSGKSTILHYAMLRVSEASSAGRDVLPMHLQSAPIPFLIELRNFVLQKAPDFVTYIVQHSRDYYDAAVAAESVVTLLEQEGQALVFFDGLDEVFDPDERRRVIDQFQTFAHRYPRTHIVVTSRIAGYDRTALGVAGFEHYTLLPLTLGQIRHFAGRWYQYYTLEGTERTAQGLAQRIVENPRLLDLAGNPLLLTMMAVIYKDRDLPNERWRLYERCADTLLEDWELGKGIEDEDFKLAVLIRTAQKSEILQRVAITMLEHGQKDKELNAIAYAPLLDIMASYLEEKYQRSRGDAEAVAVDILKHLMERTFVLAGIGERVFGFVHRTFMEYFAACRCQAQFNPRKSDFIWLTRDIYGAHWQGGEWEEVLLLLTAMLHDQGTPIREVVEYVRGECKVTPPFNVAFAARCLGEAGDVQAPAHAQALLVELAQTIAEYAPQSRKEKARQFVDTGLQAFASLAPLVTPPPAVQEAIERLNQSDVVAARMAAWQMGFALRSRKERLEYALAALADPEEVVRRGAIAALEREWPGRADIGPALANVVRNDRQARVRQTALAAMQRSWRYEPAILDAIESRVDEETSFTYVIRQIEYLATTWRANPRARDLVLALAGPKPKARDEYDYTSVGRASATALVQGWGSDPQTLPWLRERATQDQAGEVRGAAIWAIGQGWG